MNSATHDTTTSAPANIAPPPSDQATPLFSSAVSTSSTHPDTGTAPVNHLYETTPAFTAQHPRLTLTHSSAASASAREQAPGMATSTAPASTMNASPAQSSSGHRIKLRHKPAPDAADLSASADGMAEGDVHGYASGTLSLSNERGDGGSESRDPSRAATPSSDLGLGSSKKRRLETPAESVLSPRSRPSPAKDTPAASSPAPSGANGTSQARQQTITAAHPPDSLAIFAPPPTSALPQAIQDTLDARSASGSASAAGEGSGSGHGHGHGNPNGSASIDRDGDTMMREAAEGFESRLRTTRSRGAMAGSGMGVGTPDTRQGVSASGKEAKVGSTPRGSGRGGKKGKGKAAPDGDVPNQDFCSACRGIGRFLCCDGCPRSFHFMCLEPPLRVDELPDEETWYCKKCRAERAPNELLKEQDLKPIPAVFRQLSQKVDKENPQQFRLPQEIRQFFSGVSTGGKGEYVDAEETRTKYDRKGFQEERDGHRLRDARARPVACYACGGSSIPSRGLTTDPEASWRQIVSCDYCALSWHLDCLDPPLAGMPNSGRKWMCPNHVEHVLGRRRTTRTQGETIDIEHAGQRNNGNIIILPEEERERIISEDMIINKRKYRVPERVIRLDFWDKLGLGRGKRRAPARDDEDGEDEGEEQVAYEYDDQVPHTKADITAAHLILNLLQPTQNSQPSRPSDSDRSVQTPDTSFALTEEHGEAPRQKILLKLGGSRAPQEAVANGV